jgi:hypothetical protein
MTEKVAKSEPLRKKIYMTKKLIDENTTDLKFKNFNSNSAKSANSMPASTVAIPATPENDAEPAAFASTFTGKSYPYKLQNC